VASELGPGTGAPCDARLEQTILDTYHEERLPIARKLVQTTDRLFRITVSQNPLIVFWRVHVMPHLVALFLGMLRSVRFQEKRRRTEKREK
jgi:2-polyprenyl-6-methoxyphenol hydroxylase-like FAD-dependent oxidoreductase